MAAKLWRKFGNEGKAKAISELAENLAAEKNVVASEKQNRAPQAGR